MTDHHPELYHMRATMNEKQKTKDRILPAPQREALQRAVAAHGENAVVEVLGVDRSTLSRLLAGLTVQRGTIALVERQLPQLAVRRGA